MKVQGPSMGCGRMALLAIVLALSQSATASDGVSWLRDSRLVRLSTEQGLSQDNVYTILQDHQRFLWFGTEDGLNRYDGYSFKVFKNVRGDGGSLPSNWIWRLYEDRSRRLWVGTLEGLSLFDRTTETFRTFRPPAPATSGYGPSTVTSILEDRHGNLWVGTLGGGVNRVDPETGAFVATYRHAPGNERSLSHDEVQKIFEDSQGRMWVGTTQGLNRFDPRDGSFVRYMSGDEPEGLGVGWIWDIAEDREGRLWVATFGGGLNVLDPGKDRFRRYSKADGRLPNDSITCVFVDAAGTVWAGSDGSGLLRYDPGRDRFSAFTHRPRDGSSLSKNLVRSIYEDVQGNLWVGTFKGGVNLLERSVQGFSLFQHEPWDADSLSAGSAVNVLLQDESGAVWVGMSEGGLSRFDPSSGSFVHYRNDPHNPRSLSGDTITSLFEDRERRLWVGTHGAGLDQFDARRGVVRTYRHEAGNANSVVNDYIWAIAQDTDGSLWLGTNRGLDRLDAGGRFRHYVHDPANPDSLADDGVRSLLVEANGDLWVATLGGLDFLPRGATRFQHFRHDPRQPGSLSHNSVVHLLRDDQGRTWVATLGGGIDVFDPVTRKFTAFRAEDGLPSDNVYSVCDEPAGALWLGTSNGLARLDADTKQVRSFGLSNGLQGLQFGMGACHRTREGRMLFGSTDGLYFFDPARVKTDTYVPPVVFTALRVLEQPAKLGFAVTAVPDVQLSYRESIVSIEFAALDYTVPRGNSYSYRLEGFRPDWIPLGPKHEVTFTNLDPGDYTLRVRASNSDGVWGDSAASLRLVVTPPFWATWWFRALLSIGITAALVAAYKARIARLQSRERELTERVEEALARVKVLRGLLPMCAWCKKVRDDTGYWNQIDAYLSAHSEADFSHGICPDCARRIAPSGPPS